MSYYGLLTRRPCSNAFGLTLPTRRFIYGLADAASFGAVLGILIKLFPDKAATLMAFTESFFGFGYTVGPALGSFLYETGGFRLPFFVVGGVGVFFAVMLLFAVPGVGRKKKKEEGEEEEDEEEGEEKAKPGKKLSLKEAAKVSEGIDGDRRGGRG